MSLTVRQLRAWQRRIATIERNSAALLSEAIAAVGVEAELAGENFTSQFDEVMGAAENLDSYLETVANNISRKATQ